MTIKKQNKLLSYCLIAILSIAILGLRLIYINDLNGPIVFEDELGYWTHAANMNGLNWSNTLNMWYSFGYSFVLAPIFKITHVMATMYKIGVIINAILAVFGFWLGIKLVEQLDENIPDIPKILIAFVPPVYAGYLLQTNICWSETFLYTWVILTIVIVLQFFDKPTLLNAFLSGFALSFSYVIHNRVLVLLIAFALTCLVFLIRRKFPVTSIIAVSISIAAVFIGYKYLKDYLKAIEYNSDYILKYTQTSEIETGVEVYSANDFAGNDMSGVLYHIKKLTNWTNIKALIKACLGTLWYFDVGSLGLSFLGICELIILTVKRIIKKDKMEAGIFLTLTFLGTVALNSVTHMSPQLTKNYNRLDTYFYGRYVDQISCFLLILGCIFLIKLINDALNNSIKIYNALSVFVCLFIHIVSSYFIKVQVFHQYPYYLVKVCAAAIYYNDDYNYDFYTKLGYYCYIGLIVLIAILFAVSFIRKNKTDYIRKTSVFLMTIVIVIFSFWSYHITNLNYVEDTLNNQKFRDLTLPAAQVINEDRSAPLFFYAGCDYYYLRTIRTKCVDNTFYVGIPDNISFMDGIDHAYFIIPFGIDPAFFPPGQIEFLYDNCTLICENQEHGIFEYKAK